MQYQNALLKESKNVSPFLQAGPPLDPKQMTIEPPPQPKPRNLSSMGVSQSMKQFKPMTGTTVTEGEISAGSVFEQLKYSESMHTLKALQKQQEANADRPSSSMFKKGTSDFINRKLRDKDKV